MLLPRSASGLAVVVKVFLEKQNGLKATAELINASFVNQKYGRDVTISILGQFGHPPIEPELVAMLCGLFGAGVLDRLEKCRYTRVCGSRGIQKLHVR
jgi:hypothetical protein